MNIYVGNLSDEVSEEGLRQAFEAFGEVESVKIITDKYTNRSKGFGFVEMPSEAEAQSAIDGLNSKELKGKIITVNQARPRTESRRGGGGRGGNGGDRGGRGRQGGDRGRRGGGNGGDKRGRGGGRRYQ